MTTNRTTKSTAAKKKTKLGNNPLSAAPQTTGIFQKTENGKQTTDTVKQMPEKTEVASAGKKASRRRTAPRNRKESVFLEEGRELDKVTLRIPIDLNDWLDDLLKQGKRKHGQKIPKEIWVQAALELFKAMPVDWSEVKSIEEMREKIHFLENGKQNP
ncbi:MAG: hypothetical protein HC805_00510 [Alkalinema sp. RL_2_19]|nr:hypothetical protein [Alkalinema sp. RL_2_19]